MSGLIAKWIGFSGACTNASTNPSKEIIETSGENDYSQYYVLPREGLLWKHDYGTVVPVVLYTL